MGVMSIEDYLKLERMQDEETQYDFMMYVADIDKISIEEVKELRCTKEQWDDYRDNFLED